MGYPSEIEKTYKNYLENPDVWGNSLDAEDYVSLLDANNEIQTFSSKHFSNVDFTELLNDSANLEANIVFFELGLNKKHSFNVFHYFDINDKRRAPNTPLPDNFQHALKYNAFKININNTLQNYTELHAGMKTYGDLPADFFAKLKTGEIVQEDSDDAELNYDDHVGQISKLCLAYKLKKPFTLLVYGSNRVHTASYVARITADNRCELLSLNTLPLQEEYDEKILKILKNGIKVSYRFSDSQFDIPISRMVQQPDFSCAIITPNILSQVNSKIPLRKQIDYLVNFAKGMLGNDRSGNNILMRRLFARVIWWNKEVLRSRVVQADGMRYVSNFTPEQQTAMKQLFKQLTYHVSGIPCPTKLDMPQDKKMYVEYVRFMSVFNININDKSFLKIFNHAPLIDNTLKQALGDLANNVDYSEILASIAKFAASGDIDAVKVIYEKHKSYFSIQQCHDMIRVALQAVYEQATFKYETHDQDQEKINEIKSLINEPDVIKELDLDAYMNSLDNFLENNKVSSGTAICDVKLLLSLLCEFLLGSVPTTARIEIYKRNLERLLIIARTDNQMLDNAFEEINKFYSKHPSKNFYTSHVHPEFEFLLTKTYFELYRIKNCNETSGSTEQYEELRLALKVVKMDFNLSQDSIDATHDMIELLNYIEEKTQSIARTTSATTTTPAMSEWLMEWRDFQLKLTTAHQTIKSITETYLAKENMDANKRKDFQSLLDILSRNNSAYANVLDFRSSLKALDKQYLLEHRTATWIRYLYNVLSVLLIVPAIIRAANSYSKYNTATFWKTDAENALIAHTQILSSRV